MRRFRRFLNKTIRLGRIGGPFRISLGDHRQLDRRPVWRSSSNSISLNRAASIGDPSSEYSPGVRQPLLCRTLDSIFIDPRGSSEKVDGPVEYQVCDEGGGVEEPDEDGAVVRVWSV